MLFPSSSLKKETSSNSITKGDATQFFLLNREEVEKGTACRNDSGYDLPLFDKKKLWERYGRMERYPLLKRKEKSCFISALRR